MAQAEWRRIGSADELAGLAAQFRATAWLVVAASIATAYALTVGAGGTTSGFTHLFYVPVFIGAFAYGVSGGVLTGLAGGIVCFFIPLDTAADTSQDTQTWLVRVVAFFVAGALVGTMTTGLRLRTRRLEQLNEQVVLAFVRAIDEMHRYTAQHSTTVAGHAGAIARELRLDVRTQDRVRWAALLHDIGKVSVPLTILDKSGSLTAREWDLIRGHPEASVRIISGIDEFKPYLPGIHHHHERYDGSGYPDGLRGDEIPLEARIIAVADTFDALTGTRAYRASASEEAAFAELERSAGTHLDPTVVQAFIRSRRSAHPQSAEQAVGPRTDKPVRAALAHSPSRPPRDTTIVDSYSSREG
jgi:putative nucleotidyltransferase with HDIG domain